MIHRARETKGGMAKITTMEEFAKTMLDSSRKIYKTHCLMMFVSNKSAEKMGEEIYANLDKVRVNAVERWLDQREKGNI